MAALNEYGAVRAEVKAGVLELAGLAQSHGEGEGVSLLELKQRLDALSVEQAVLVDKILEDMAVTAEKQGICIQSNSPKCCFCFIDTAIDYNRRTIHNSSCT